MTTDFIIATAIAKDKKRLSGANSDEIVAALNKMKDGERRTRRAAEWLRGEYAKARKRAAK